MGTIYSDKINAFISNLEDDIIEMNHDIKKLETRKEVYTKIINDLKNLKELKWWRSMTIIHYIF